MNKKKGTAVALILLMVLSGCLGAVSDDSSSNQLPDDWKSQTQRTVSQPQLVQFDSCTDMENALKASIAEEYRTQLLQAVDEMYYYGDEMLFTDDVAESSMDGDGAASSTAKSQPTRTEGEDFSGTNNQ